MAAFAQFASDLDKATQAQLARGERLTEILKQGQYVPLPVEKQVLLIFAGTNGLLDDLPTSALLRFEAELYKHVEQKNPEIFSTIRDKKTIDDELKKTIIKVIGDFKSNKFVLDESKAAKTEKVEKVEKTKKGK
jgi:F-type H+-transporting ATPase subunit alpha